MEIDKTDAWIAYLEIRKAKNRIAPFTPKAMERILSKLRMFAADGQNPEEVLWASVENGWTGVFPIKRQGYQVQRPVTVESREVDKSQAWIREHSAPVQGNKEKVSEMLAKTKQKLTGAV